MQRPREDHFPLFDSLRAIALMTVFLIHGVYQPEVQAGRTHWWYPFMVHFDISVPIFFGISGFLLYRPFVAARARGRPVRIRAYAWRRFLRIVPAYWVGLTLITFWFGLPEVRSLDGILRFYGFAQIYFEDTALRGLGQAWTLNVEVTYYALLPLFAWALAKRPMLGVLGLMAFSMAYKVLALKVSDAAALDFTQWHYPLPNWLDHLGVGMLLAVLSVRGYRPRLIERWPSLAWAAALAFWLAACAVGPDGTTAYVTDPEYLLRHVLYTLTVGFMLAPGVFGDHRHGAVRKLLGWRPLAFVGTVSYSFYLIHFAVIVQFLRWFSVPGSTLEWVAWATGAFAGSLLLAWIGYECVEKQFMSLNSRVSSRAPGLEAAQARAAP